jgi:hypothetical protein
MYSSTEFDLSTGSGSPQLAPIAHIIFGKLEGLVDGNLMQVGHSEVNFMSLDRLGKYCTQTQTIWT